LIGPWLFSKHAVALLGDHSQEELNHPIEQLQAVLEVGFAQDVTCK
jgi:hypothetical protein